MGPPLPPSQLGTSFSASSNRPKIQIECFLDLICPFSVKLFNTLYEHVLPELSSDPSIEFILHQVIQPWHPQGTFVHEAALACQRVAPEAYFNYVHALMAAYKEGQFQDEDTWNKSRAQIYQQLMTLLPSGVDREAVLALLQPQGGGNSMTPAIKWICKLHRTRGVHVTPTVFVNGVEATVVSSGWTKDEWLKFLEKRGADNFQN